MCIIVYLRLIQFCDFDDIRLNSNLEKLINVYLDHVFSKCFNKYLNSVRGGLYQIFKLFEAETYKFKVNIKFNRKTIAHISKRQLKRVKYFENNTMNRN